MTFAYGPGKPARLTAKHQHNILACPKGRIPEHTLGVRREKERGSEGRQGLIERFPARRDSQVDVLPVVETGAPDLALVEREAKRLDQVKGRPGRKTGSSRVAGVPMNFGMDENDVDGHSTITFGGAMMAEHSHGDTCQSHPA